MGYVTCNMMHSGRMTRPARCGFHNVHPKGSRVRALLMHQLFIFLRPGPKPTLIICLAGWWASWMFLWSVLKLQTEMNLRILIIMAISFNHQICTLYIIDKWYRSISRLVGCFVSDFQSSRDALNLIEPMNIFKWIHRAYINQRIWKSIPGVCIRRQ
jgi:hypothetical protein